MSNANIRDKLKAAASAGDAAQFAELLCAPNPPLDLTSEAMLAARGGHTGVLNICVARGAPNAGLVMLAAFRAERYDVGTLLLEPETLRQALRCAVRAPDSLRAMRAVLDRAARHPKLSPLPKLSPPLVASALSDLASLGDSGYGTFVELQSRTRTVVGSDLSLKIGQGGSLKLLNHYSVCIDFSRALPGAAEFGWIAFLREYEQRFGAPADAGILREIVLAAARAYLNKDASLTATRTELQEVLRMALGWAREPQKLGGDVAALVSQLKL